jgi:putative tricarboxylic transport membrane protein
MLGETIMSLFIFVATCYLYYEAAQLRVFRAYKEVGPDFWPKIVLFCLIVLSALLTVFNVLKWRRSRGREMVIEEKEEHLKKVFIAVLLTVGYVYFLKPLGFIVASPLFIIGIMFLIMPERKRTIPFTVLGIMFIIYIIFDQLLFVPLPKGFGVFHDISIFLGL